MSNETEYHSKDFEWEDLEREVESDPSLSYHLQPFSVSTSLLSSSPSPDSQAWSDFHTRHSTGKFFKERRYLLKEFPELLSGSGISKILEVGCGNGSTVLPILRGKENIIIYACDCSTEALEKARMMLYANEVVSVEQRFHPFCCNFATSHFPKWLVCNSCRESNMRKHSCSDINESRKPQLPNGNSEPRFSGCCVGGVDFVSLIFTLSAVPLYMMPAALRECFSVLKPGGLVLFRDYGLYDMTMLRFEPQKRVGFREYTRSDGTHSYFFSLDTVSDLFSGAGFIQLEVEYCCVKSLNRKIGKNMRRVCVHAKFQKPIWKQSQNYFHRRGDEQRNRVPLQRFRVGRSGKRESQAWSDFYTRHSTGKFFKERRYLLKEFPKLLSGNGLSKILEVGCGNGSTVLPILRGKENIIIYACDCSSEALEKARMMLYAMR